jgi:hypothetical protein
MLLIDAITSPPKNVSPLAKSEHFHTPEQSPVPPPHIALNAAANTGHTETDSNRHALCSVIAGSNSPRATMTPTRYSVKSANTGRAVTISGGMKRIGDQLTEDEKPSKQAKTEVIVRRVGGPKETKGVTVPSTARRLRSGKRV